MNEEIVDILLATYNSNEKYLKQQIESILNQTYKNIHIYISDDASPNKNIINIHGKNGMNTQKDFMIFMVT